MNLSKVVILCIVLSEGNLVLSNENNHHPFIKNRNVNNPTRDKGISATTTRLHNSRSLFPFKINDDPPTLGKKTVNSKVKVTTVCMYMLLLRVLPVLHVLSLLHTSAYICMYKGTFLCVSFFPTLILLACLTKC